MFDNRFKQVVALAIGVLLGACDAPSGISPRSAAQRMAIRQTEGVEAPIINRFYDLQILTEGSFRPGKPIRLKLTVASQFMTPDALIRVWLPDSATRERSASDQAARVGKRIPTAYETRATIREGSSNSFVTEITFAKPGYYQVSALVQAPDGATNQHNGNSN